MNQAPGGGPKLSKSPLTPELQRRFEPVNNAKQVSAVELVRTSGLRASLPRSPKICLDFELLVRGLAHPFSLPWPSRQNVWDNHALHINQHLGTPGKQHPVPFSSTRTTMVRIVEKMDLYIFYLYLVSPYQSSILLRLGCDCSS